MSKKSRQSSAARAAEIRAQQARAERRRNLGVVGAVVVAIALVVGVGFYLQSQRDTTGQAATPPAGVTDTYGVTVGQADAPKTITVYEDFQCPICHDFEQATMMQVRQGVADGTVKVDYRMVAFLDHASSTDYSSRALNAAGVVLDAAGPDVFLKFHDLLFDNQPAENTPGLSDDELIAYAVQAGATEAQVSAGIKDNAFHQWVLNATDQMSKEKVTGTPTVFIDGTKVEGQTVQDTIDATLAAVG